MSRREHSRAFATQRQIHGVVSLYGVILPKDCNEIRLIFWGLPEADTPRIRKPVQTDSYTVVCPVVTEWALFDEYLRQARALAIEVGKGKFIWTTSLKFSLPLVQKQALAPVEQLTVFDSFKDSRGTIEIAVWLEVPVVKGKDRAVKRPRIAPKSPDVVVESVADVFNVLEAKMASQGIRLIDMYRFCNKLSTPVTDMTALIDRYVDHAVPLVHRTQFWALLDSQGSRIFTFADFSQKFKVAKRAMATIQTGIKQEVTVTTRFKALYEDMIATQPQQKLYKDMDAKTLIGHLRQAVHDVIPFEECCLLATLYLELPKQTNWTLEEIRRALKMKPLGVHDALSEAESKSEDDVAAPPKEDASKSSDSGNDGEKGGAAENDATSEASNEDSPSEVNQEELQNEQESEMQTSSRKRPSRESASPERTSNAEPLQLMPGSASPPLDDIAPLETPSGLSVAAKQNVTRLLSGLIFKCEVLLTDMPTCAQGVPSFTVAAGALPVAVGPEAASITVPKQKLHPLGLPDDPEQLVQDVMSDTLLLQTPHTVSVPGCLSALERKSSKPSLQSGRVPKSAAPHVVSCRGDQFHWARLVLHQLALVGKESAITATIKAKGFSKTVKWRDASKDIPVLLPFKPSDSRLCLMIEIRSESKGRASPTKELVGVAKVETETRSLSGGGASLDRVLCPVTDIFTTEDKGVAEISLFGTSAIPSHSSMPARSLDVSLTASKPHTTQQMGGQSAEEVLAVELPSRAVINERLQPQLSLDQKDGLRDEDCTDIHSSGPTIATNDKAREFVQLSIHCIRLLKHVHSCFVRCSLENDASVEYRSPMTRASQSEPLVMPLSFHHSLAVPETHRDAWFAQSLILKVFSVEGGSQTEELVGEMQLDMSCLTRFGRICGLMGLMNHDLKKTGDVEVDIQLQRVDTLVAPELSLPLEGHSESSELRSLLSNSEQPEQPKMPLQTCSDDEDYVVIGGLEGEILTPRDREMDDLCDLFHGTDLENTQPQIQSREPNTEATIQDPFFCDDDFMLDISRGEESIKGDTKDNQGFLDDSFGLMPSQDAREPEFETEDIVVTRFSSEQLCKEGDNNPWRFKTTLPTSPRSSPILCSDDAPLHLSEEAHQQQQPVVPIDGLCITDSQEGEPSWYPILRATPEVDGSDGKGSAESVDIDDLLQKYNIERRPGWWKSLMEEDSFTQRDPDI